MSVPPLVCSTPPPPDQEDEIEYNDEFGFHYEDSSSLSPSNYEPGEFNSFGSPVTKDSSNFYVDARTNNTDASSIIHVNSAIDTEDNTIQILSELKANIPAKINDHSNPSVVLSSVTEESNIEDLDLKLDSLQIDFENDRVSVEDNLNSTFDDFGTFLSTSELNDGLFISKELDADSNSGLSDRATKSQETNSEDNVSLPNDDNSDFDVGWEQFNQISYKNSSEIIPNTSDTDTIPFQDSEDISTVAIGIKTQMYLDHYDEIGDAEGETETDFDEQDNTHPEIKSTLHKFDIEIVESQDVTVTTSTSPVEVGEPESIGVIQRKSFQDGALNTDEFCDFTGAEGALENVGLSEEKCDIIESIPHIVNNTASKSVNSSPTDDFDGYTKFQNASNDIPSENVASNTDIEFEADFQAFISMNDHQEVVEDDIVLSESANKKILDENDDDEDDVDDDFGDFDTYDPSNKIENKSDVISDLTYSLKITDLIHTDDSEIIEILNKAVSTIYPGDSSNESKPYSGESQQLKTVLGDSWTHLREYEAEQSYLFAWNNSSSQKSLLKSLGIDSRNILFGPKWNSSMPRFAANLGTSPLQPIKQTITTTTVSDCRLDSGNNPEMFSSSHQKSINDWDTSDNFTMADSQASSYAESLLLDLEHLMATLDQMTSGQASHFKISDLFSTACNERGEEHIGKPHHQILKDIKDKEEPLQPPNVLNLGRKINLPDTHIFTPTDSETPWSHTIHYDDANTNFSSTVKNKEFADTFSIGQTMCDKPNEEDSIDEFDDFQSHDNMDFPAKVTDNFSFEDTIVKSDITNTDVIKSKNFELPESNVAKFDDFGDFHSATVEEQPSLHSKILPPVGLLEPVKISPMIPVVNWPEPGEITTTVFSDINGQLMTTQSKENSSLSELSSINTYSPSSISFILKESKIDAETCKVDKSKPAVQDASVSVEDTDDFTDFQSVSSVPQVTRNITQSGFRDTLIATRSISENIAESVFSNVANSPNEDFNDFQSVEFNPVYNSPHDKGSTKVSSKPSTNIQSQPFSAYPKMEFNYNPNSYSTTVLDPVQFQRSDESSSKNNTQQILQPLSLENYSQINWPDPGIDLQDLSRFNPINSIQSYSEPKVTSKSNNVHSNEDDGWTDFISIKTNSQTSNHYYPSPVQSFNQTPDVSTSKLADDSEDWSDFVSGTVLPSRNTNEVKTISQNIHSQSGNNASYYKTVNQPSAVSNMHYKMQQSPAIAHNVLPHLSYISPKANVKTFNNSHFQNL